MSDTPTEILPTEPPAARPACKRPAIVGGAAAAAVLIGAGAFAFVKLSGGGTQPHDVLPNTTIAYARVDLDPSAGQKVATLRLIRKFPDLARELGIKNPEQDVRRLIVEEAVQGCDIDFDTDVEPWLGSRVGIAAIPASDVPDPVFALQVDDEGAARKGLRSLEKCGGEPTSGIAFLDGYAIVAETQAIADRAKAGAVKAPLADDQAFSDSMSDLGDEGLASAWVDMKAVLEVPAVKKEFPGDVAAQLGNGSIAVTLRAKSDALEIVSTADGLPKNAETAPIDIGSLPGTTAAAIGIRMPAEAVRDQWDAAFEGMEASGEDLDGMMNAFESDTGLRLPEDLETLFSGGLTLAVGERNLDTIATMQGPPNPADFDLGIRMGDPKAEDLAARLIAFVRDNTGLELSSTTTKSGTVIATNAKVFKAGGKTLADSGRFEEVVGEDAQQVLFVNLHTIIEAIAASDPPPDVADVVEQLGPLGVLGMSYAQDGEIARGSLTLTFDE